MKPLRRTRAPSISKSAGATSDACTLPLSGQGSEMLTAILIILSIVAGVVIGIIGACLYIGRAFK